MFKPSLTIHKSPTGALSVIECSEDAAKCEQAYKDCIEEGEIQYIRNGRLEKQKKIAKRVIPKAKKSATKKASK